MTRQHKSKGEERKSTGQVTKIYIYHFDPQPKPGPTRPGWSDNIVIVARDIYGFVSVHPFTKVGIPRAHPWRSLFSYINTY